MPSQRRFLMPVAVVLLLSLVTTTGRASEAEPNTKTLSERYVVPEGDVGALVEFIRRLSEYRPTTVEEDVEHRCKFQPALKQAAEKIVGLESDQTSPAYEAAEFILLTGRVRSLAQAVREEQDKTLADVKAYVVQRIEKGQGNVAAKLAELAAKTCQATGQYELAAETYRGLGELIENCDDRNVTNEGRRMRATAERLLAMSKSVPQAGAAPELPAASSLVPLDLQSLANRDITELSGPGRFAGNGLAELQKGEQTFSGVRFHIGDKLIQADKVEGIPVNRRIARLCILHATEGGSPSSVKDGTVIGRYKIRFDDGSEESVPIVYGEDVRDWWDFDDGRPVTRGRVVWTGGNIAADKYKVTIRLYLGVWENTHPGKMVNTVNYISSTNAPCKPFCVAITVEEPSEE